MEEVQKLKEWIAYIRKLADPKETKRDRYKAYGHHCSHTTYFSKKTNVEVGSAHKVDGEISFVSVLDENTEETLFCSNLIGKQQSLAETFSETKKADPPE